MDGAMTFGNFGLHCGNRNRAVYTLCWGKCNPDQGQGRRASTPSSSEEAKDARKGGKGSVRDINILVLLNNVNIRLRLRGTGACIAAIQRTFLATIQCAQHPEGSFARRT